MLIQFLFTNLKNITFKNDLLTYNIDINAFLKL